MPTFVLRAALAVLVLLVALPRSLAEDARQNGAGQFDFYVLSLSWSPSFCAAAAEDQRCNAERGRIHLSSTGCGRNTTKDFQNIAKSRRRDCTAASFLPCSI
jgi:hypothetical protein